MSQTETFRGLAPQGIWDKFEAVLQIPRPSGKEAQIAAFIESRARKRGFAVLRDGAGNLCVRVPATPGREGSPVVILQSHLDMVCERNASSPYDPENGLIRAVREGEWVRADGTTLGADNGIGVCAMLHAAEADTVHGPLDLLFTVDEETGPTGARFLDPSILRGRIMINLDSEDDGEICIGCAGGRDTLMTWTGPREPAPPGWTGLLVSVSGLLGGHSGMDINRARLNAIRGLTRLLQETGRRTQFVLAQVNGGNKRNAIPREADAALFLPAAEEKTFHKEIGRAAATLRAQYHGLDDGLVVAIKALEGAERMAFTPEGTRRLLDLLRAIPSGVVQMSTDIPGLVETSNNLAVVRTAGDAVDIVCLSRSSLTPAMQDVLGTLGAAATLAGARVEQPEGFPGWKPDLSSRALAVAKEAHARLFGSDAKLRAVHAGLECGLIDEKIPDMDMVSFGPQINDAHSAGEKVHIPSVEKFWRWLTAVLEDLST